MNEDILAKWKDEAMNGPDKGMTVDQTKHAMRIIDTFRDLAFKKYQQGAKEHGGNLWEVDILPLLYELRAEAIDSFVYVQTAIDELERK